MTDDLPLYALVVSDDDVLRSDVTEPLDGFGFSTREVAVGDEAIRGLEDHRFDVTSLFAVVEMPGSRDGSALAQDVSVEWSYVSIASGRMTPGDGDTPKSVRSIGKPFSAETVHGRLCEILPESRQPEVLS